MYGIWIRVNKENNKSLDAKIYWKIDKLFICQLIFRSIDFIYLVTNFIWKAAISHSFISLNI